MYYLEGKKSLTVRRKAVLNGIWNNGISEIRLQRIHLLKTWCGNGMSKPPNAKHSLFRYKAGNSALHRLPAWIKILIVPALNLIFFFLPVPVIAGCIFLQCIAARAAGFSFKEQLEDMRPLLYYAVLLYCTQFLTLSFHINFCKVMITQRCFMKTKWFFKSVDKTNGEIWLLELK